MAQTFQIGRRAFLAGSAVAIGLAQGGQSASASTTTYGQAASGSIAIVVERSGMQVSPETIRLSVDLTNSGLGIPAPADSISHDEQFHDIQCSWGFGTSGKTFDKPQKLLTEQKNADNSYSPNPVRVFEAGTHTITLTCYNRITGASETATVAVFTVAAQSTIPTNMKAHVHPSGTTTNAPAGVTTYTTIAAADAALTSQSAADSGIIYLERGQTYADNVKSFSGGHRLLDAVGSGARPVWDAFVYESTSVEGVNIYTTPLETGTGWGDTERKYLTVANIDFESDWNPVAETGTHSRGVGTYAVTQRTAVYTTIYNCDTSGVPGLFNSGSGDKANGIALHLENVSMTEFETYPIYMTAAEDSWFSAWNVRITQNPNAKSAYTQGQQGAPIRLNGQNCTIEGFELFANGGHPNAGVAQPAMKWQIFGNGAYTNQFAGNRYYAGRGYLESSGSSFEIGGDVLFNAIIERCVLVGGHATSGFIGCGSWGLTTRDNLIVLPKVDHLSQSESPTIRAASFRRFMGFDHNHEGSATPPSTSPMSTYNNTMVMLRDNSENSGFTAVVTTTSTGGHTYTENIGNNIVHIPNLTTPTIGATNLDASDVVTPYCIGWTLADGTLIPRVSPPFGTFRPQAGSSALDTATTGPTSAFDLTSTLRTGTRSQGAFETV